MPGFDPLESALLDRKGVLTRAPEPTEDAADDHAHAHVAERALSSGDTTALTPGSVSHLQRAAGNAAVSGMLEDEQQGASVLDVVGKGGGAPLPDDTREKMEAGLGHDFSDVRVHTGGEAAQSASSVQAQAYTVGRDVVFGEGQYSPGTASGDRMLAHELTHVVQQSSGPVGGTPTSQGYSVSDPSDQWEQAAERSADQVVSGGRSSETAPPAASSSVQRQAEEEELPAEEEQTAQGMWLQRQEEEEVPAPEPAPEEEEAAPA